MRVLILDSLLFPLVFLLLGGHSVFWFLFLMLSLVFSYEKIVFRFFVECSGRVYLADVHELTFFSCPFFLPLFTPANMPTGYFQFHLQFSKGRICYP